MSDTAPVTSNEIFGTDGVRGVFGEEMTSSVAGSVARAYAHLLREDASSPVVLMARDTRPSGPELAGVVAQELARCDVSVTDCGILPTGGLCLLVKRREADAGVIISASHNPPEFNGVKLVGRGGRKLSVERHRRLEDTVRAVPDTAPETGAPEPPSTDPDADEEYLRIITEALPAGCLTGLRVVLDCAHGAASEVAPRAFERKGANVTRLNCDRDGGKINVDCGSTSPEALARAVVMEDADLGVAFDGDADRAIFVDGEGDVIDGDGSKYVLAIDRHRRGLLDPPLVVGTVMNNFGLERALTDEGIELERTPVGDRHVAARMRETGAWLGGEQAGHIMFRETMIGDGTYTALQLCEVVARTGRTLAELSAPVEKIPQHLVNVPAEDRDAWQRSAAVVDEIERWQQRLNGRGRVLVRASGTEPLVRVMVEAADDELARKAADAISVTIRTECG